MGSSRSQIGHHQCEGTCLVGIKQVVSMLKMGQPRPLFCLFLFFQTSNTIFTTKQCEKCHVHPVYGTRIQTHYLLNMSHLP